MNYWRVPCGICKISGGELQTSNEDLQYICGKKKKNCCPKFKKVENVTSSLKSLEDELRAEMSKNALVRIKRGLSRDQTQEVYVVRSLEAKQVRIKFCFLQIHLKIKQGFLRQ